MKNAARQPACPTFLSGGAEPAKQACSEGTVIALAKDALQPTAPSAASLSAGNFDHSQQPSSAALPASSHAHPEGHTDSEEPSTEAKGWTGPMQGEAQVPQHREAQPQKPPQLEEATIDWAGEESAQPSWQWEADSDFELEVHHAGWSDSDAEEYDPEAATAQSDEDCHDLTHGASLSAAQHATHRGQAGRKQKDPGQKHRARINSCLQNGGHAEEDAASAVHGRYPTICQGHPEASLCSPGRLQIPCACMQIALYGWLILQLGQ